MEWFGKAHITFTHSPSPIALRSKNGSHTDLGAVCKQSTPACYLNPFLFNGHLQTMWTAAVKHGPPIHYRRKVFDADHKTYHGTFAVDFVVPPHDETDAALPPRTALFAEGNFEKIGSDDKKPMLIVLHGLSGGSHEIYLRHCIQPLIANGGEWEVCVVNSRGCAESTVTSGVLFNARATWDVRQIANWARETFPNRPLFGLGFSLGANILTNVSRSRSPPFTPPLRVIMLCAVDAVDLVSVPGRRGPELPNESCRRCGKPFRPADSQ